MRVVVPVVRVRDELFVSPHFGRALGFAVYVVEDNSYRLEGVYNNPVSPQEKSGSGRGRRVLSFVFSLRPDIVVVKSIGSGAFYNLREMGIRIYRTSDKYADEAIEKLVKGELEELKKPIEFHSRGQ
ncbi:MAG: NifB/NifX family molybdenum-iron cluster-binding protein [Desulfurococcales archaeon]|nr:NifB/NifX family molybdenum-iron cluster-binding protein [Desulfurococcales archaeon]